MRCKDYDIRYWGILYATFKYDAEIVVCIKEDLYAACVLYYICIYSVQYSAYIYANVYSSAWRGIYLSMYSFPLSGLRHRIQTITRIEGGGELAQL